jgi:proline dehydrogenase
MKLIGAGKVVLGEKAVEYYMNLTAGQVFSAGETESQLRNVIRKLTAVGALPIIDYCAEGVMHHNSPELEDNFRAVKRGVQMVAGGSWSSSAVKVSALIDIPTLKKLNSLQLQLEQRGDLSSRYESSVFSMIASPCHHIYSSSSPKSNFDLSCEELRAARDCLTRLEGVLDLARSANVAVMIDAEQTYLQAAIDSLTVQMQKIYNTHKAQVCNTFQCYLHETAGRVPAYIEYCHLQGLKTGIKLVRGAYMNEESRLAKANNTPSPLNPSKADTDSVYNQNLSLALDNTRPGSLLCVATHNDLSIELVKTMMHSKSVDKRFGGVVFAQLLGMKDMTTVALAKDQYLTAKYVPFGPISKLMPYLIRRALESYHMMESLGEVERQVIDELTTRSVGLK